MAIDISQFYQVFFEESKEHLAEMEQLLLKIDIEQPDADALNAIFRAAHSIKGGSATFGFNEMTAVTHVLESLLDRLRKKELNLNTKMVDVFLQAADVLNHMVDAHMSGKPTTAHIAQAVTHQLTALATSSTLAQSPSISPKQAVVDDDFGFFDDDISISAEQSAPAASKLNETSDENDKLAAGELQDLTPNPEHHVQLPTEASSIRVNIEKVDHLVNLVGELVIAKAMLMQGLSHAPPELMQTLNTSTTLLDRHLRDLQEAVLSVRMMPISQVFARFPRLVRDLASKLDKNVALITLGSETELDKGLIEKIADPLTHLIRNSLDHGLESSDVRKALGKPEKSTITLSASHQGGSIVIEVTDDGAGLNQALILKKAKERGIYVPAEINSEVLWDIISQPGFSTADAVTDVSGRGVGMDVVRRNIAEMGGQMHVFSQAGKGCTFSIRLPLTLAIMDGMLVSLGESVYVIALNSMIETMQPLQENIKSMTGEGLMIFTRGEYLPIIALHKTFNTPTPITHPCQGMLVIVEAQGKKAALLVDALVGQQQVVVKSLETNFRKIDGISGATILGDGTVAMIIDVFTMIKLGQMRASSEGFAHNRHNAQTGASHGS